MPLTDAKIKSLKPRDKPYKVADFAGLYVEVRPTGSKIWRQKYRFGGREKRLTFGAYPALTLADARVARDAAKASLAKGIDPGVEKRVQAEAETAALKHTFSHFADAFQEKARKEGRAEATQAKNQWLLDMAKKDLGHLPISDITAPVVLECVRKVEEKGHYETSQRLRAKISAVFRFAVASGVADNDPAHAIRDALIRPQSTPRAAITDPEKLGGLLRSIDGYTGQLTTRIGLQLQASLAQRPGELRHAEWQDVDLTDAIWLIPAERMKMRRPHRVPLPRQALELFEELHEHTGNGRYLFPSLRSYHRPMSENTLNGALRHLG